MSLLTYLMITNYYLDIKKGVSYTNYSGGECMFEKEAEEYAIKEYEMSSFVDHYGIADAFQEGAEFGYNKANEWNKQEVNDIYDLILEDWSIRYFICIMKDKRRVTAIGNCDEGCNGDLSVNLVFDYDDEKYCLDDIVWWKEIVLPKEIKEM